MTFCLPLGKENENYGAWDFPRLGQCSGMTATLSPLQLLPRGPSDLGTNATGGPESFPKSRMCVDARSVAILALHLA